MRHLKRSFALAALGSREHEPRSLVPRLNTVRAFGDVTHGRPRSAPDLILQVRVSPRQRPRELFDAREQIERNPIGVQTVVSEAGRSHELVLLGAPYCTREAPGAIGRSKKDVTYPQALPLASA